MRDGALADLRFNADAGNSIVLFFAIVAVLVIVAISVTIAIVRREERLEVRGSFPLIHSHAPVATASKPTPKRTPAPASRPRAAAPEHAPVSLPRRPELEVAITTADEPEPSATVRFRRPTGDAVQLLPGRLEVVAGEPRHTEIRLVRVPGEPPEVILGRELGDAPGHIALQSTTVSRRHARLAYANGEWKVANLSQTNPVVVNEEALSAHQGERTLADGDCLELGEVVLRFHAR